MVIFSSFIEVKSLCPYSPGRCSWGNITSFSGPRSARQRRIFRCSVRNCPSVNLASGRSHRRSKIVFASSQGAHSSICSISAHPSANGSVRVRYVRPGRSPFGAAPFRYLRAVVSLIPLLSADRSSVSPSFSSFISLLTCCSLTNHALPWRAHLSRLSLPLFWLFGGDRPLSSSCRWPTVLMVAEHLVLSSSAIAADRESGPRYGGDR